MPGFFIFTKTLNMPKPDLSRVPTFYHNYISKVQQDDINAIFETHQQESVTLLQTIPETKWDYRYAEGKWSIKELVQHIIDAERIFAYRALCFARKDSNSLPGFDENTYVVHSKADNRTKSSLINELQNVQRSTADLFASFDDDQLDSTGTANGNPIYVLGIGFIIVGHVLHHLEVLKTRYLQ